MIFKILEETSETLSGIAKSYTIATEQEFNHVADSADFPAIVLINDYTSQEGIAPSGLFKDFTYSIRIMVADKLKDFDNLGSEVLEVFSNTSQIARTFMYNFTRNEHLKELSNQGDFNYRLQTFENLFDTHLAGVFLTFDITLRFPQDYCKLEC